MATKQNIFILLLFLIINIKAQKSHSHNLFTYQNMMQKFSEFTDRILVQKDLEDLISGIIHHLVIKGEVNCVSIICDSVYLNLFEGQWFKSIERLPIIMIVVKDSEDLLSPNYVTLESIRQVRKEGCRVYIILIANGIQTSRLLRFGDRYRVIDTRAKFIILHDLRLFTKDLHFIWKRIINVVFIRHHTSTPNKMNGSSWFELSTVPFPSPIRDVFVPKRIQIWKTNTIYKPVSLFVDKTLNIQGHSLQIVTFQYVPAVVKIPRSSNKLDSKLFTGMEIEIMRAFATVMNFIPKVYEPLNANIEQWGHKQLNGSFSGLLGEMVNGKADIALGNLHYTPYHLQLTDLTIPYLTECLTFLTPESLTDNSWKTLILPFKLYMWVAVLIVLFTIGFIFYSLALFHKKINENIKEENKSLNWYKETTSHKENVNIKRTQFVKIEKAKSQEGLFVFQELTNSILYTYGMLLVISLPKLPPGWSIRLLTGWYWLYCVLVVVAYRASMTAILANPTPRVTIDTIQQLAESSITCGGWGDQTKEFFITSLDEYGQKIGSKFQTVNDADKAIIQVTKGKLAYYGNIYFLKYLSSRQKMLQNLIGKNENDLKGNHPQQSNDTTNESNSTGDRNLHIMKDCAIHMPISIGLQKNSPLKPRIDKLLRKIVEAGLVEKWLNDVMVPIYSVMSNDVENVKALMNLQKLYAGFVALGIGYFLSFTTLLGEIFYWKYVVQRDPNFDIYAMDLYYKKKNAR